MRLVLLSLAVSCTLLACEPDRSLAICTDQAGSRGPEFTVAGAYTTTVQKVRDLQPQLQPPRWPDLSADTRAYICYLDGPFGEAPGGGEPYDRAVVAVAGEQADVVILGYGDEMPVRSP